MEPQLLHHDRGHDLIGANGRRWRICLIAQIRRIARAMQGNAIAIQLQIGAIRGAIGFAQPGVSIEL